MTLAIGNPRFPLGQPATRLSAVDTSVLFTDRFLGVAAEATPDNWENAKVSSTTRNGVACVEAVDTGATVYRRYGTGRETGYLTQKPYRRTWWQKVGSGDWEAKTDVDRSLYFDETDCYYHVYKYWAPGGETLLISDLRARQISNTEYAAYCDSLVEEHCGGIDARDWHNDDQLALIPNAMGKLRNGGTLKILLMGDSYRNGLSGTPWEALLMREYPLCEVVPYIAAIGSTGAEGWNDQDRIDGLVVIDPDLIIFGGISSEWNPVNPTPWAEMIAKLRATLPTAEIAIGSFGNGLHDTSASIAAIATSNNVAYFDESTAINAYASDMGTTTSTLIAPPYGDGVHFGIVGWTMLCRNLASFLGARV